MGGVFGYGWRIEAKKSESKIGVFHANQQVGQQVCAIIYLFFRISFFPLRTDEIIYIYV